MLPETSRTGDTEELRSSELRGVEPAFREVGTAPPSNPTTQAFISPVSPPANAEKPSTSGESVIDAPPPPQGLSCPNEYEVLIRPDSHSVVDNPLLLRTPYIVNTQYMVLICTHCKHAVCPNSASTHANQFHPHCKVPGTFVRELAKEFPDLVAEKIHPGDVIRAIFGLAVPMEQHIVCARCLRGYSSVQSWRHHVCEKPDLDLKGKPPNFLSLVQTFFREPKLCYFPIETPTHGTNGGVSNDFDLFKSQFQPVEVVEDEIVEPADYRELDQFLSKEGWISHVAGCLRSELSALTSLPQQDEVLAPVMHETFLLMSRIQSIVGTAGFHVRRLLGRRPP